MQMVGAMLVMLALVSAMLAIILVIVWSTFGRPRHAFTWATAFGLFAVMWTMSAAIAALEPVASWPRALPNIPAHLGMVCLAIGFRQRVARAAWPLLAAAALAAMILLLAVVSGHAGLAEATGPLFGAAVLLVCMRTLVRRGAKLSSVEVGTIVLLLLMAAANAVSGVLALAQGSNPDSSLRAICRAILVATQPAGFIGLGLFIVALLASDICDQMRSLARIDPLTAVLNRRGFEEAAARMIANGKRWGLPISVVLADLDRFKAINDRHGHAAGDHVLRRFADHVGGAIREGDLIGRIGGEEFAIIFANSPAGSHTEAIERVRGQVAVLECGLGEERVTASFGVTALGGKDETLEIILARADAALYEAKVAGRNRVMVARPPASKA